MARTRTTARDELLELGELASLCDVLRDKGVVRYARGVDGSIELVMGPPVSAKEAKVKSDPLSTRRAYYEQMLCRPVGDKELEMLP